VSQYLPLLTKSHGSNQYSYETFLTEVNLGFLSKNYPAEKKSKALTYHIALLFQRLISQSFSPFLILMEYFLFPAQSVPLLISKFGYYTPIRAYLG
jgi:hypothetical protein